MEKKHFDKIFWYIVGTSLFVLLYVTAITFIPLPKENQRFADTSLGFLLGTVLAGGAGFLVGGTSQSTKKNNSVEATGDISSLTVNEEK